MKVRQGFAGFTLLLVTGLAWARDKVVYHVSDTEAQALGALRNVRNHPDADPSAKITLTNRNPKKDQFIQEANLTPSGVVRITQLQLQGYAYIRP